MSEIEIVQVKRYLIPTDRILREYWHLEPYLRENSVSLHDLTELSFMVTQQHLSFDHRPHFGWSVLSIMEDHFLSVRDNPGEITDDEAIAIQNLTQLAFEIHTLVTGMVHQYIPPPAYGYHSIQQWVGNNILIDSYK